MTVALEEGRRADARADLGDASLQPHVVVAVAGFENIGQAGADRHREGGASVLRKVFARDLAVLVDELDGSADLRRRGKVDRRLRKRVLGRGHDVAIQTHDELVDLVMAEGGLSQMTDFFDKLQNTHQARMRELGLA